MGNIPGNRNDLFTFAQAHMDVWQTNAAAIGLTPAQATAVTNSVALTQARREAVESLRTQARTATTDQTEAFRALRTAVAAAVNNINTFAGNQPAADRGKVYSIAQIQPPQPRTPSAPPGQPTDLSIALNPTTGALLVRWRCTNPDNVSGVVYNVKRRIGAGAFAIIGATGEKRFEDFSIPAGTSQITYTVQAQHGSALGQPSTAIDVRFGTGSSGEVFIASTGPSRLAA